MLLSEEWLCFQNRSSRNTTANRPTVPILPAALPAAARQCMAQRYPTYFDGIVSGAPAMRTNHSNLALRSMVVTYNQIAPRDAEGKPVTAQALSDSDRKLVLEALLAACDARDGLADGMIFFLLWWTGSRRARHPMP
jgi:hypothetical protein